VHHTQLHLGEADIREAMGDTLRPILGERVPGMVQLALVDDQLASWLSVR